MRLKVNSDQLSNLVFNTNIALKAEDFKAKMKDNQPDLYEGKKIQYSLGRAFTVLSTDESGQPSRVEGDFSVRTLTPFDATWNSVWVADGEVQVVHWATNEGRIAVSLVVERFVPWKGSPSAAATVKSEKI